MCALLRDELPRRLSRRRPSPSCRPTSSARSSISARRRRSTCRSAALIMARRFDLRQPAAARGSATFPASPTRASSSRSAPDVRRRRRPHARPVYRPDRARRDQQPGGQSGRHQPGRADLLAQPEERRVLSDRGADAAVPARFAVGALQNLPITGGRRPSALQVLGGVADVTRTARNAVVSPIRHPAGGADLCDAAGARSRRGRAATIRQVVDETASARAQGRDGERCWARCDDEQRLLRAAVRPRSARSC